MPDLAIIALALIIVFGLPCIVANHAYRRAAQRRWKQGSQHKRTPAPAHWNADDPRPADALKIPTPHPDWNGR